MTRREALERKLPIYTADAPCAKGHYHRYSSNGNCVDCTKQHVKDHRAAMDALRERRGVAA